MSDVEATAWLCNGCGRPCSRWKCDSCWEKQAQRDAAEKKRLIQELESVARGLRAVLDEISGVPDGASYYVALNQDFNLPRLVEIFQKAAKDGK